jgi:hypothetical protein
MESLKHIVELWPDLSVPEYITIDDILFYFNENGSVVARPKGNIGKEPIALDATLETSEPGASPSSGSENRTEKPS